MNRPETGELETIYPPQFVILAGPNGSGKSTSAPYVLPSEIPYLNADEIAKQLPENEGVNRDFQAGRQLLEEWNRLSALKYSFAVETTLASRSLACRIQKLLEIGYEFHLLFFWLPDVELAIARVVDRVRRGGHDIPEETIRRRYKSGFQNLFHLFLPLAATWRIYDNRMIGAMRLIAAGKKSVDVQIFEPEIWGEIHHRVQGDP